MASRRRDKWLNIVLRLVMLIISILIPFFIIVLVKACTGCFSGWLTEMYEYFDGIEMITIASLLISESLTFIIVECRETVTKSVVIMGLVIPLLVSLGFAIIGSASIAASLNIISFEAKVFLSVIVLFCFGSLEYARQSI